MVSYQVSWLIGGVNHIIQRVGEGYQSGATFSYGLGKIYDLIIVQIARVHCNQATRDFAAPLGHGVKSTGAEPGRTARMCQCASLPSVAVTTLLT